MNKRERERQRERERKENRNKNKKRGKDIIYILFIFGSIFMLHYFLPSQNKGLDVNAVDKIGWSPAMYAALADNPVVMEVG